MFRGSFKLNFKLLTLSFAPFGHSGCVTNTTNQKHFIWLSYMDWSKNKMYLVFLFFFSEQKWKNGLFCHQQNSGISFTRYWHPDFLWRDGVGLGWVLSRLMKFWNCEKFKIQLDSSLLYSLVYFINSFNMVSTILFKMEWPDKRIVILYSLENSIGTLDIVLKKTCTVS